MAFLYNDGLKLCEILEKTGCISRKGKDMAGANVHEFTSANWDQEVVKSDKPVLVDFWAPWCGPCRALAPAIERIANQFVGKIKVGKLNTEDNQDLAIKYGINSIPRVLIFKGSDQPLERVDGNRENEILKAVNRVLETA
jgi:thioredoxin 1